MDRLLSDEREVQHFDFSSTFLMSEMKTSIIHNLALTNKEMANCIIRKRSLSDEAGGIIHSEMENLSELYKTKLDESIKKHTEGIRELFAIPKTISFTSCKVSEEFKNINSDKLLEEVKLLEEQYQKNKKLLVVYKEESANFERTSALQEQVTNYLDALKTVSVDANKELSIDDMLENYKELVNSHPNHRHIRRDAYLSKFKTQDESVLIPEL